MSKRQGLFSTELLQAVGKATGLFSWPPVGSYKWIQQARQDARQRKRLYNNLRSLRQSKLISATKRNGRIFLKLTSKGQLELLLRKATYIKPKKWDSQWRLLMFDIPEEQRTKRDKLRWLLKKHGFVKLQASVFISPYVLNREAIAYLKTSGLIRYIRIVRANEIDDDRDLRKKFKLK